MSESGNGRGGWSDAMIVETDSLQTVAVSMTGAREGRSLRVSEATPGRGSTLSLGSLIFPPTGASAVVSAVVVSAVVSKISKIRDLENKVGRGLGCAPMLKGERKATGYNF